MRGLGWIVAILLIVLLVWYFGFYNDKYEAPENRDETSEIEENVEDLLDTDFEITREDASDEFYFTPTSRFSLLAGDGEDDLEFDCDPEDAIGRVTEGAGADSNLYRFEALQPGTCRIEVGDWVTTVRVLEDAK